MIKNKGSLPIIALWAYPRTLSTPVERVFIERNDCTVFHEPFFNAFYYSKSRSSRRHCPDILPIEKIQQDYHFVLERILSPKPKKAFVFFKDMTFYSYPYLKEHHLDFYRNIINTFIIRNPREAIISHFKISPDLPDYPEENGIPQQFSLFEYITRELKQPAIVIDADLLSHQPEAVLREYCAQVGISYNEQALTWQAGETIPAWEEWQEWHVDTLNSSGIYPVKQEIPNIPLPAQLEELIKDVQPYYDKMRCHAIGINYNSRRSDNETGRQ